MWEILAELREVVELCPFPDLVRRGDALLSRLEEWAPPRPLILGRPRSPGWQAVRDHWLKKQPKCAACGGEKALEVHHVVPFHLDPSRELDETNLVTLCDAPSRHCHFIFGHCYRWAGHNPHVREDAAHHLCRVKENRELYASPDSDGGTIRTAPDC